MINITRSPGLPRGFVYLSDKKDELQILPISSAPSSRGSRAELFLPTVDGVTIVEATITEIEAWAAEVSADFESVVAGLIDGVLRPKLFFAGLTLAEPVLMGVVNVTPDSFHDGGRFNDPNIAIKHGISLIESGAKILDIGGESTRPGGNPVSQKEEIKRVLPVLEGLLGRGALISIDTRRVEVMRISLAAGAAIINDINALCNIKSIETIRDSGASVILMHMQGQPKTMQLDPRYRHAPYEVAKYLAERVAECERLGLSRDKLAVDPGIGFGKSDAHNFAILNSLTMLHGIRVPVVLGVSRKSFIGRSVGANRTEERLPGTIAATLVAIDQGIRIHRVHDVSEIKQALEIWGRCRRKVHRGG